MPYGDLTMRRLRYDSSGLSLEVTSKYLLMPESKSFKSQMLE